MSEMPSASGPAEAATHRSAAGDPTAIGRRPRRVPPWFVWAPAALLLLAIVLLRGFADVDPAARNIATFVLAFVASLTLLVWFVLRSAYAARLRYGTLAVIVVGVAAAAAAMRIEEFDGSLAPILHWRWLPSADRLLPPARAAASEPPADLATTTDHDFPQFLGPHRDATIADVELARDWQAHPPELVWRQPIGAGWSAFALVGPYAVTLEQRGPDELITCYKIATGELVWAQSTATRHESTLGGIGPRSTPTIYEGKVYAQGATGRLHCLEGATGRVVWEKDLLGEFGVASPAADMDCIAWGRAGSPLVVGDLVVVPAGGPTGGPFVSLVAYDRESGREAWRGGQTQIGYASPSLFTIDGVPTIVIVNESNVTGHDPKTGAVLWEEAWPGSSTTSANNSQAVALDDHRIFLSKGYGAGAKLFEVAADADSEPRDWQTRDLWSQPGKMQTKFTNVVRHDGSIFGLSDVILECIDQETGARRWKKGRYGYGQILLVGDAILVLSETGELALVAADPKQFTELAKIQALEGKTWNNLAFSTPYLLIRNGQEAACYRLPLAGQSAAGDRTAESP
ncbi:MAG TPA: PQQ-binding-like beta-propeller repeat protein [Pirellulales bacterium]|jgi:outer membrane protein assembly factor BamB|nr:PQQ-binding-like beta-propeller repeat protein [Pirellulales bacterium]